MQCPACRSRDSRVIDSRTADHEIRRRRECELCGHRFTTYERVESAGVRVVKKDGRREPFNRDKLIAGVRLSCEKRPVSVDTVEALVDEVERAVRETGNREIRSYALGEMVMARLRDLDQIAYVRFASVHRAFADLGEMRRALDELDAPIATVT